MNSLKKILEMIELDIEIGDTIKTGRFKNHKVVVNDIGEDEHGMPTVNGKQITKIRIPKNDPTEKDKKELEEVEKIKCKKCDWSWDKSDGGKDMYICHKCGNDNAPLTEQVLRESFIEKILREAYSYKPVKSSNLSIVGYDPQAKTLQIEFHSGNVYEFSGVSALVYKKLMASKSKGQFFNKFIKDMYNYEKIESTNI